MVKYVDENRQTFLLTDIKAIKTWPVVIFILRRRDNVIGRIKFLTSSTIAKNGAKTTGDPEGIKLEKNLTGENSILEKIYVNQNTQAALKVKTI